MKLLVVLPWMPYPLNDGGKQGSFNMLEQLQYKLDIVLIYPVESVNQLKYQMELQERLLNIKIYPFEYYHHKGNVFSQFFLFRLHRLLTKKILKQPYLATPVYEETYINFVNDVILKEKIDVVQNEYVELLYLVYTLPQHVKRIFVQHEIQYINKKRNIQTRDFVSSELQYLFNKIKQDEISAMNQYDFIVTMTEADKEILVNDGVRTPIYSSPSFIPLHKGASFKACTENNLTFIGGSVHYPNLNGICWFLKEVWPLILEENGDIKLNIIGRWTKQAKKNIQRKYSNVNFLGFVPRLCDAITGTIMVVPILIGSGIRMKIFESVNCYTPFVTTKIGVEGLDFKSGEECIVTDDPREFAKSILELTKNVDLQQMLAENAHKKLLDKYSSETSSQRRLCIYEELYK